MSAIRHYVRTLGPDGGVEVCEGPAIGLDLASMLRDGLPPWNIALQIFAGLCEILDIADQDGKVHGDLGPRDVFVDDTGAVSVEGMDTTRPRTSAPEGTPRGHATDLYGLGRILFSLLGDRPLPELPDDPASHGDAVIDAVLLVDLAGLPEEIQGDVQWFLAKLLAHDPAERPSALEAWRSFLAFAESVGGPDFVDWCSQAIDGGGERRSAAARALPEAPPEEALGGPVKRSGPLTSAMNFGPTGPAKGGATAFWTRDQMKAALDQPDDDDHPHPDDEPFRPAVGGGSATAFWSTAELAAMQQGSAEAPRPKRSSKRSQTLMMAVPRPGAPDDDAAPEAAPEIPAASHPIADEPTSRAPVAQGPVAAGPVAPPVTAPVAPPTASPNRKRMLVFAAAALTVVFLFTCLGLGGLGAWLALRDTRAPAPDAGRTTAVPEAPSLPDTLDEPEGDAPEGADAIEADPPEAADAADGEPARPDPAPRQPKPAATPTPKPASSKPAAGPARVRLSSSGRGSVSCAGGQQAFDGAPITLVVEAYQLPATCLVEVDGERGVFQVYGSGSVRCDASDGGVTCDPSAVR